MRRSPPFLRSFTGPLLGLTLMLAPAVCTPVRAEAPAPKTVAITADERARCLAILRTGLASDEFWPSMHAAEALTLAGRGSDVIASLKGKLPQETNDQRRCGLVRELVRAGDAAPLPVLWATLNDTKSNGRIHAAESLYKLGVPAEGPALAEAFSQDEIVQLKLMSAAALARLGSRSALESLRTQFGSDDKLVRNTVCFALARLGTADDLPMLRRQLERETDPLARANLVNALACLGDTQARKDQAFGLESTEPGIRASTAEHVGHARAFEHRPRLVQLLDDPGLDVRIRAAQSLIALSLPPVEWRKR